ncbi:zinc-binding dehydrogenase [Streptomonospora sp. S1-112]|uniref:Zinc-binding dehydrogenase n=1 Tax=Streptomonospora mangrovi TaxID=2883123 RepID=A0A9X3SDK4_9ACTN|nr:zinc-binding dehydrogenase [Streptomonospora mangrovi]MDA0563937.1 zinc-binding dehydrogenase [Streptomonospora mangrovi]
MRSAYIEALGPPEHIRYGNLPPPRPAPGEVLVDVAYTAVNHVDTFVRSGAWRTPLTFPFVIGRDLVGTVAEGAPPTAGFRPGERVWSLSMGHAGRQGAAAEQVAVPADRLYRLPPEVPGADAAALAHPAATAYLALFVHGGLRPGARVVVVGAGGNVGGAAVVMAAEAGARVTAVASAADAAHCRDLGAEAAVDYRTPDLAGALAALHPEGADLIVDAAGRNDVETAVPLLARRGRMVLLAGMATRPVLPAGPLYLLDRTVTGFAISQATTAELAEAADHVAKLAAAGRLRPRRVAVLPLSEAAQAHRRLEAGEGAGLRFVLGTGLGESAGERAVSGDAADLTNARPGRGRERGAAASLSAMSTSIVDQSPLFEVRAETRVSAPPSAVYQLVSDLPSQGRWSPECRGGEWVQGEPGAVGSVFRGENYRAQDVVGWAPLVRGTWHTEARVVAAEPDRTFRWMMLSHAKEDQESVWGFDIVPDGDDGSVLIHHFRMGRATAGIHKIVADLDEEDRKRFIAEWTEKLESDLAVTLSRIKDVIEQA